MPRMDGMLTALEGDLVDTYIETTHNEDCIVSYDSIQ
jgi:hypothetical protein